MFTAKTDIQEIGGVSNSQYFYKAVQKYCYRRSRNTFYYNWQDCPVDLKRLSLLIEKTNDKNYDHSNLNREMYENNNLL